MRNGNDQRSQLHPNSSSRPPLGYANNGHKYSASNLDEVSITEANTPNNKQFRMRSNVDNRGGGLGLNRQVNSDQPYGSETKNGRRGMRETSQRRIRNRKTSLPPEEEQKNLHDTAVRVRDLYSELKKQWDENKVPMQHR